MTAVATVLTALVALIHVHRRARDGPLGHPARLRRLRHQPWLATQTKVLAANQGLYNGFLVAGLVLALVGPEEHRYAFAVFTLSCVVVAGVYGAVTASRRILWVQALPAALALVAQVLAH